MIKEKPPIGIKPKWLWEAERYNELIEEYAELYDKIGRRYIHD